MKGLVIFYCDLGRGQEAIELGDKVLEASQRTLGSEHPDTLNAINGLAVLKRGKVKENQKKKIP